MEDWQWPLRKLMARVEARNKPGSVAFLGVFSLKKNRDPRKVSVRNLEKMGDCEWCGGAAKREKKLRPKPLPRGSAGTPLVNHAATVERSRHPNCQTRQRSSGILKCTGKFWGSTTLLAHKSYHAGFCLELRPRTPSAFRDWEDIMSLIETEEPTNGGCHPNCIFVLLPSQCCYEWFLIPSWSQVVGDMGSLPVYLVQHP